jgi:hypothetical protein
MERCEKRIRSFIICVVRQISLRSETKGEYDGLSITARLEDVRNAYKI